MQFSLFSLRGVAHTVAMGISRKVLKECRETLNADGAYQTLPRHVFSSASSRCPWLQEQRGPPIAGSQWWEQPPLFFSQLFTISSSIPSQNKQKRTISITIEKNGIYVNNGRAFSFERMTHSIENIPTLYAYKILRLIIKDISWIYMPMLCCTTKW